MCLVIVLVVVITDKTISNPVGQLNKIQSWPARSRSQPPGKTQRFLALGPRINGFVGYSEYCLIFQAFPQAKNILELSWLSMYNNTTGGLPKNNSG